MNGILPPPNGKCWCGCGTATEGYFARGHDKRAEAMLLKIKHGPNEPVAAFLHANGYGGTGMNLLAKYSAMEARARRVWNQ